LPWILYFIRASEIYFPWTKYFIHVSELDFQEIQNYNGGWFSKAAQKAYFTYGSCEFMTNVVQDNSSPLVSSTETKQKMNGHMLSR
jgi:hypothetical protein